MYSYERQCIVSPKYSTVYTQELDRLYTKRNPINKEEYPRNKIAVS
jgi:hypothetical protein